MELPLLSNPTQMSDIFSFRSCEHLRSKAHPAHARYWLGARKERVAEPPNSTEALVLSAKTGLACRRILWVALHLLHVRSRLAGGHICRVADGVPDDVVGQHIQPAAVAVALSVQDAHGALQHAVRRAHVQHMERAHHQRRLQEALQAHSQVTLAVPAPPGLSARDLLACSLRRINKPAIL